MHHFINLGLLVHLIPNVLTAVDGKPVDGGRGRPSATQREQFAAVTAWSQVDACDLAKRPSSASISSWFPCSVDGHTAWTDGAMVDLVSEPHLPGWQDRLCRVRAQLPAPDIARLVPRSEGVPVAPAGMRSPASKQAEPMVALASRCQVAGMATKYWRYFASKFGPISARLHRGYSDDAAFTIWCGERLVGVVMPFKVPAMTPHELQALLEQADALRTHTAQAAVA